MLLRRLTLIACAVVVIVAIVAAWDDDPFVGAALIVGGAFVGFILLAGWRQLDREVKDAERIARSRDAQRDEQGPAA